MNNHLAAIGIASLCVVTLPVVPAFSRPLPEIVPVAQVDSYRCYVITQERRAFDLSSLCGGSSVAQASDEPQAGNPAVVQRNVSSRTPSRWGLLPDINSYVSTESTSGGTSGGKMSGSCASATDRDSAGNFCGGRAADQRPGGR